MWETETASDHSQINEWKSDPGVCKGQVFWLHYFLPMLVHSLPIVIQSLSSVQFLWPMMCSSLLPEPPLSSTISWSLLKFMSIELVMLSNYLILCRPLRLLSSVFPSIRVFSDESALHIRPKYWSFSFSISPFNEYSELVSFRIDWFDLLAV